MSEESHQKFLLHSPCRTVPVVLPPNSPGRAQTRCHPARSCFKSIKYFTHSKIALGKAWIALAGPGQALKMLPPSRGADTAPENASGGADKQE